MTTSTTAAVAPVRRRRRPEPEGRRSHQPVRRDSRLSGTWESGWIRSMTWADKHELMKAARLYDRANKKPGDRNGPIGSIGLEILEELATLAVTCRGRVWPSLDWLQERVGRCRSTIVDYLRALADVHVLEWARRLVVADGQWERGPQVEQTSNLYRLALPKALRKFVRKAPPAADEAARKKQMLATIDAAIREEAADGLDAAIARGTARGLAKKQAAQQASERELERPTETAFNFTSTRCR